jgi:dienelactone hydrolase
LGYAAFALDMFGDAYVPTSEEVKKQLIKPMVDDRKLLMGRITAAFETLKKQEWVDTARIAAMGYCFGGMCVLDLARSGAEIRGVVSFHGLLKSPSGIENKKIAAKIIAFHGNEDPMVPPEQVREFANA